MKTFALTAFSLVALSVAAIPAFAQMSGNPSGMTNSGTHIMNFQERKQAHMAEQQQQVQNTGGIQLQQIPQTAPTMNINQGNMPAQQSNNGMATQNNASAGNADSQAMQRSGSPLPTTPTTGTTVNQ